MIIQYHQYHWIWWWKHVWNVLKCYLSELQKSRFVIVLTCAYLNKSHGATRIVFLCISFCSLVSTVPGFYCRGVGRVSQRQRPTPASNCSNFDLRLRWGPRGTWSFEKHGIKGPLCCKTVLISGGWHDGMMTRCVFVKVSASRRTVLLRTSRIHRS